jgi:tetratricopeptide (TPR) repeat protein
MKKKIAQLIQSFKDGFGRQVIRILSKFNINIEINLEQNVFEVREGGVVAGFLVKVFNSTQQVVAALVTIFIVLVITYMGITGFRWYLSRPAPMNGDLNIAVAEFRELPEASDSRIAPIASQRIFHIIDTEFKLISSGIAIEVAHAKMPVISEAEEARKLSERVNAHIVIYGDVSVLDEQALISPRFYISEQFQSDLSEITGLHKLALPVPFSLIEIIDSESPVTEILHQKLIILIEFTKALTYLAANQFELAEQSIEITINEARMHEGFEDPEVILLVASTIAKEQKDIDGAQSYLEKILAMNNSYGRAYIAQGNIYYDLDDFDRALEWYEAASNLSNQPYSAHIQEKAHLGIGNIYTYLYQLGDESERSELAQIALNHLQPVIATYENTPEMSNKEAVALAYYDKGIIYQWEGKIAEARRYYKKTISLTLRDDLRERAENRLNDLIWIIPILEQ